jgi:hypothetical protein
MLARNKNLSLYQTLVNFGRENFSILVLGLRVGPGAYPGTYPKEEYLKGASLELVKALPANIIMHAGDPLSEMF